MGCATSKQQPLCRNCQVPCSPMPRSYSKHVHHPPEREGDSYHMVALTSSTLGSLKLDPQNQKNHQINHDNGFEEMNGDYDKYHDERRSNEEFSMGTIEAKTWSKMINEKIPKFVSKTPIRTPPGEPETINAWELMEGLDDISPLRPPHHHHLRSFSFNVPPLKSNSFQSHFDQPTPKLQANGQDCCPKPLWLDIADNDNDNSNSNLNSMSIVSEFDSDVISSFRKAIEELPLEIANNDNSNLNLNSMSVTSEFDPDVISTFRKALEELPPTNPFQIKPLVGELPQTLECKDIVPVQIQSLEVTDVKKINGDDTGYNYVTRGKDKVVVYFTSLRGVRKTYEDCCHVKMILKGLGVKVDERDMSMDSGFKDELKELLGDGLFGGGLPRVFVGKKYIGGAEEIRIMHEEGQLEKVVECCEMVDDGDGGDGGGACEACGDVRFVPCETCSGSCKIYYEGEYDEEGDEDCEYGFQRCPDCNENGLIRCPICCD